MLNVALIGCGYWGPNLARNFFENDKCRLTWCCDLRVSRLRVMQNRHPSLKITADFNDVLKDPSVDAVAIATPLPTHYRLAKLFLEAGKHVLVEKPLTHNSKTAEELMNLARRRRRVLMAGYTYIYSPHVQKIKELIDAGRIGDVRYVQSSRVHFGHLKPNEGVLWDLVPHDIAVMLHWLDLSECNVSCAGNDYFGRGHHETISLNITSKSGQGIYIFTSLLAPLKMRNMVIAGTKKMIFYNDTRADEKIKVFDQCATKNGRGITEATFNYKTGHIFSPHVNTREPLQIEIEDFVRSIERGKTPASNPAFALRIIRILEAAEKSLKLAKTIKKVSL